MLYKTPVLYKTKRIEGRKEKGIRKIKFSPATHTYTHRSNRELPSVVIWWLYAEKFTWIKGKTSSFKRLNPRWH